MGDGRRKEILTCDVPEDLTPRARGDARGEQGRRAVDRAIAAAGDFVQRAERRSALREMPVSILLALKPEGRGLTVVGDDAQSIYSFRAATVRNILDFPNAFRPSADIITLDRNYRSTQPILTAANGVIGLAAERFTKNLWTERHSAERPQIVSVRDEADQAGYIVERVLENREVGTGLKQQAVLFLASHHSGPLEVELTRRNIPFVKFGGLKFLDSAHIKDLLAVLRFGQNPRDRVAGFRLMLLIPGVGPSSAQRVLDAMADQVDPLSALWRISAPPRSGQHWNAFVEVLQQLHVGGAGWPAEMDYARRWYEPHLERMHEDAAMRQADLLQLEQIAAGYISREQFLTELTLDPPDATSDQAGAPSRDEDYLVLSTIHSAKGQEWKSVFVLNVVDGCIPSDLGAGTTAEIEEERRLLYVAMTRARQSASCRAAALLYTRAGRARRPACVRVTNTLYSGSADAALQKRDMAPGDGSGRQTAGCKGRSCRRRRQDAQHVAVIRMDGDQTRMPEAAAAPARQRKIIHIDMDAFYASVEQRDNPELRGKPVAVGGSRERGVVAAASYEARKFGVRSAMPSITAKRQCPDLIFVNPRFDAYKAVSLQIREIFAEHTHLIEPLALDEAYLDVTENRKGIETATEIAMEIRAEIREETGLTASAGVSYNKFLAKLASDHRKPDGLFVITPKMGPAFVEDLPVGKFHGVGPATTAKMNRLGIQTGLDLRAQSMPFLQQHFGKSGAFYYWIARGVDDRPVLADRIRKSVGAENTFSVDLFTFEDARDALLPIIDKVWRYCESSGTRGRTVTLKIKYADFKQITRCHSVHGVIDGHTALEEICLALLKTQYPMTKGVRLLGISISALGSTGTDAAEQLTLGL